MLTIIMKIPVVKSVIPKGSSDIGQSPINICSVRLQCTFSKDHMFGNVISNIFIVASRVWSYQRGNQNPQIKGEQTTQWAREKVQRVKQRYTGTKQTHKTNMIRSSKVYFYTGPIVQLNKNTPGITRLKWLFTLLVTFNNSLANSWLKNQSELEFSLDSGFIVLICMTVSLFHNSMTIGQRELTKCRE